MTIWPDREQAVQAGSAPAEYGLSATPIPVTLDPLR